MPMSAQHYCSEPGCGVLIRGQPRCEAHTRERNRVKNRHDHEVKKRKSQFYKTAAWAQLRMQQLTQSPFCEWTYADGGPPCGRIATVVDHIVPRENGGADNADNFQSLCHSHHSKKTVSQTAFGRNKHADSSEE